VKRLTVKLRAAPWSITWPAKLPPPDRDAHGTCKRRNQADGSKGGLIRIDGSATDRIRMETEIHEIMHACLWDLDEAAVSETARDMAKALWKIGYRIPPVA